MFTNSHTINMHKLIKFMKFQCWSKCKILNDRCLHKNHMIWWPCLSPEMTILSLFTLHCSLYFWDCSSDKPIYVLMPPSRLCTRSYRCGYGLNRY
jgi:hypothetical protein